MGSGKSLGVILVLTILVVRVPIGSESSYSNSSWRGKRAASGGPLLLTPLIQAGKISEAKWRAYVYHPEMLKVKSYAGFFSVGADEDPNHLFFWYFPSKKDPVGAPVIAYIESAFGVSSLYTLFAQNGPFSVNSDGSSLELREESWNKKHHVIYMDSAVGSGFSYTEKDTGYPQTLKEVGNRVCKAVLQYFQMFPHLRENDFYLAGETFAGKLIPEVALCIQDYNFHEIEMETAAKKHSKYMLGFANDNKKIKLQGIVIANGYTHPETQLKYAQYFLDMKKIVLSEKTPFDTWETEMNTLISRKQHKEAFESAERFFKEAPMQNVINKFNVQNSYTFKFPWNSVPSDFKNLNEAISEFFNRSDVAKALHVGSKAFTQNSMELKNRLVHNITESHLSTVEKLLSQYRFLILTGKKDLSCPHEFVVSYLSTLSGDVGDAYRDTKRLDWRDEKDEVIGSIVKAGRLTEMLLDNSGHLISVDNEKNVVSVLEAFTEDSFGVNEEKPVSVVSCMKKEGRFCALYRSFVAPSKIFPFNSYAGYINVNEKFNSNLFFWYVVAKEKPHTAPVILCLHGVLGRSSLFKLFNANGPVTIRDGFVEESLSSWHKTNHVIYIDSPIGAGYSYTDSDEGYSTSDAQVAANLREALIQLFKLHPQLRKNGLFLVGDNYAGKFIPALGHSIHLYNEKAISSRKINFRGMLISNGYVNPLKQLNYTTPLSDDIITDECKSEFLTMEREVHDLINKDKHYEASEATLRFREKGVCDWGKDPMLDFPFTALGPKDESEYDRLIKFLNRTDIRRILHVGNRAFANFSQPVFDHLKNDITRSQAETLKVLLNHYRVLILSGRADSICPYTNVRGYLREIIPDFPNFADIKMTEKFTSKTECKLKKFGNLTLLELDRLGNWIFENNQDLSPEILNGFVAGSL